MKVLLISTTIEAESREPVIMKNSHYPLGLAYIHSYLEQCGHIVKTLFLNDYDYDSCLKIVNSELGSFSPDFAGIQLISHNRVSGFRTIEFIHEKFSHIKLFTGGIHATIMYEQILKKYPYLVAVLGEGEITCNELIQNYDNLQSIDGIAYIDNNELKKTKPRELIKDLDTMPFPKHEIFFNPDRTLGNMLTSRGCPCACSFCVLDSVSRRKVRYRSANNVVDEIEYLIAHFPNLDTIWIHDDSFFLDNQRVIDICNEIVRRNIKMRFISSGRMKPLCKEMVDALERAGFIHVMFGLESGSDKILKNTHKGITKADARRAFALFANSHIIVTAFLIVGLYGENDETNKETADFIQELQQIKYTYYNDISILAVYPGTEVYQISKVNGILDDEYWMTDKPVPYFTVEHDAQKLHEYKEKLLNRISFNRIFSFEGFKAQRNLIPQIIRYGFENGVKAFVDITTAAVNEKNLFPQIVKDAFSGKHADIASTIGGAVDKYMQDIIILNHLKTFLHNFLCCGLYSLHDKFVVLGVFFERLDKTDYRADIDQLSNLIAEYNSICIPGYETNITVNISEYNMILVKAEVAAICMEQINISSFTNDQKGTFFEMLKLIQFSMGTEMIKQDETVALYNENISKYYRPFMEAQGYSLLEHFLIQYIDTIFSISRMGTLFDEWLLLILHYLLITIQLIAASCCRQAGISEEEVSLFLDAYLKNIQNNETALLNVYNVIKCNNLNDMNYMVHLL